jgi:tRNA pseudouridine55 synthase
VSVTVAADTRPRLWLVDKPAGPTSHDVVARVRRAFPRGTKVGHTGTLDPFATGLLVILSGRATRLADLLSGLDKRYRAVIRTGFRSATGDPEGPIVATGPPAEAERIAAALADLRGPRMQRVPALAAVKVGGEPLYARARRGEPTERPERPITIHALELVEDLGGGRAVLEVHCSKGTYIRQLCEDIGASLGCGAYCEQLRRTRVGSLDVGDAIAPERIADAQGLEPLEALGHVPRVEVDAAAAADLAHGRAIEGPGEGRCLLLHERTLVAIGEGDGSGRIRPRIVLAAAESR